jgi:hypothetical protein
VNAVPRAQPSDSVRSAAASRTRTERVLGRRPTRRGYSSLQPYRASSAIGLGPPAAADTVAQPLRYRRRSSSVDPGGVAPLPRFPPVAASGAGRQGPHGPRMEGRRRAGGGIRRIGFVKPNPPLHSDVHAWPPVARADRCTRRRQPAAAGQASSLHPQPSPPDCSPSPSHACSRLCHARAFNLNR